MTTIILASGSAVRAELLRNAKINFETVTARIDETTIKNSLLSEKASPHDIADALAEIKARKVSQKSPEAWVIGCDQVLNIGDKILSKPEDKKQAIAQLTALRGDHHNLLSAVVVYHDGEPQWRFVGKVRLAMRNFSDEFLASYVERNWHEIKFCVGSYQLESEGVRLFSRIDGDFFHVLGLPLIELLNYLSLRGVIKG